MRPFIAASLLAVASLTGAASANPVPYGVLGAIAHFNLDREGGERIRATGPDTVSISSRGYGFDGIFAHFNADADSRNDIRGQNGATLYPGRPAIGASIFDRLDAE
ncbi:hypothetical protein [Jannaschia formosa]|uniref:hypothetical protein n=1 Tax=Jannaschia formosa TaxID=2259592 RepID=UPI000E1B5C4C|nr:hypothetical protein [Jannaschia formosa]TFL19695.1 hypothetical protein DR046_04110 [Jannaschia formosa]